MINSTVRLVYQWSFCFLTDKYIDICNKFNLDIINKFYTFAVLELKHYKPKNQITSK